MTRFSTSNDIKGIIELWNESFGDSEEDILFFLKMHYKPDNTLVYESDGMIVSVLFLLEGDMHIKGIDYPSYYLYAACTLKNYRGRGIMAELLRFAEAISAERNKFFIALKPGEESLYDFYLKFGYKPVFRKKIAELKIDGCLNFTELCENFDCGELSRIRDNSLNDSDYFKWNNRSIEFAINHHKYYGGNVFFNCKGYILYTSDKRTLFVKENTFTPFDFLKCISYIANDLNSDTVVAELPVESKIECIKDLKINSGMLLPLCDEAELLLKSIDNAYLALTLD